jgi:glycerophosphoryl diester phosphodiesterase
MHPRWLLARPVAHRGLHDVERPENSLPAFDAACDAGYPIELDVHLGIDRQLLVFHDDTLERMTGTPGRIDRTPCSRLGTLRLAGTDESIPQLPEVLARIRGRVPLFIELKSGRDAAALVAPVLEVLEGYRGEVALQSFNPWTLAALRRRAPGSVLGLLSSDFADGDLSATEVFVLRRLLLAPLSRPDYVGYELRCLPYWAASLARRLGAPLLAWTVRTAEQLARSRIVADNCIFETVRPT